MTRFYAVVSEAGPTWDRGRPMREQAAWSAHAVFMDALADEGFVVLGGPIGDGDPHRAMLIVDAPSREEVERRLAEDPWRREGLLTLKSVEPWAILLDGQGPGKPATADTARARAASYPAVTDPTPAPHPAAGER